MTDDWIVIKEQIERSKITRIKWKKIFGMSLTQAILLFKKDGLTSEECFIMLRDESKLTPFIESHFEMRTKILNNLKISVSARYGEAKTEDKILRGK